MPWSARLFWLRASLTSVSLLTLTSCATRIPTVATKPDPPPAPSACVAFPRLTFSRLHDTDETIRQIKGYDAARDALCGPGN